MSDYDRAQQIANVILAAPPGGEDPAAYAIAGLILAVLHAGDEVHRLAREQQAAADEVSRLADAVEQYLKHAKGI